MNTRLLVDNLLSPPMLFFALGLAARLARSTLEVPRPITQLFSLYLLWAIGYKGGVKLAEAGLSTSTLLPLAAAVGLSAVIPLYVVPLLRLRFNTADACACAASYGSVSAVTFIAASNFLTSQNIPFSGHMVAALALMEAPAIVVAVLLYRRLARDTASPAAPPLRMASLLREAFLSGPVFLLLGSMIVGALSGPKGYEKLQPFTEDVFYGVLVLFLIDAGMNAAQRLPSLKDAGAFAFVAAVALPLAGATLALGVAAALGMPRGDAFLLIILTASASYIAVPAAMQLAIPNASPGLYLPMALGVTFPFNLALGIPLYLFAVDRVLGP